MDCPRCGAHSETDVGSCLSCGAALVEADESLPTIAQKPLAAPAAGPAPRLATSAPPKQCPNCMTLNAATFKFCARCGTPLGATAAPTASTPAPARPPARGPATVPSAPPSAASATAVPARGPARGAAPAPAQAQARGPA